MVAVPEEADETAEHQGKADESNPGEMRGSQGHISGVEDRCPRQCLSPVGPGALASRGRPVRDDGGHEDGENQTTDESDANHAAAILCRTRRLPLFVQSDRGVAGMVGAVMEMPPLGLMVLDALMDDHETVETMRSHGDVAPYGLALVNEADVIAAIGELLNEGLVEALDKQPDGRGLAPVSAPRSDLSSLRRYWFRPTDEGRRVLGEAEALLDAYWMAHPI